MCYLCGGMGYFEDVPRLCMDKRSLLFVLKFSGSFHIMVWFTAIHVAFNFELQMFGTALTFTALFGLTPAVNKSCLSVSNIPQT